MDDNTRMLWKPVTGGSNVPAMNEFLLPAFGMALGGTVLDGVISLPGGEVTVPLLTCRESHRPLESFWCLH